MRRLPLLQISTKHFYEYNSSVKSSAPDQPVDEIKYLLPRLLELVAQHQEVHHSVELFLDRLGNTDSQTFTADERHAISQFAAVFFADFLHSSPESGGSFCSKDAFDVLLMFDRGGIDISPLLQAWCDNTTPWSMMRYVYAIYWNFSHNSMCQNGFTEDRPEFQTLLKIWVEEPKNRAFFKNKILLMVANEAFEPIHLDCGYNANVSVWDMFDAVLEA